MVANIQIFPPRHARTARYNLTAILVGEAEQYLDQVVAYLLRRVPSFEVLAESPDGLRQLASFRRRRPQPKEPPPRTPQGSHIIRIGAPVTAARIEEAIRASGPATPELVATYEVASEPRQ